jgi:hypothetical protein
MQIFSNIPVSPKKEIVILRYTYFCDYAVQLTDCFPEKSGQAVPRSDVVTAPTYEFQVNNPIHFCTFKNTLPCSKTYLLKNYYTVFLWDVGIRNSVRIYVSTTNVIFFGKQSVIFNEFI